MQLRTRDTPTPRIVNTSTSASTETLRGETDASLDKFSTKGRKRAIGHEMCRNGETIYGVEVGQDGELGHKSQAIWVFHIVVKSFKEGFTLAFLGLTMALLWPLCPCVRPLVCPRTKI